MADQQEIDATIDRLHKAGATDDEVTSLIKEKYGAPFDVKAQNAVMRANMAKQPEGAGVETPLASFARSGPMGNMDAAMTAAGKGEGAKAVHQAVVGTSKVLAPMALPLLATPAGVVGAATMFAGGVLGDVAARSAASLATDNPDYQDVAGDVGGMLGGAGGFKFGKSGAPAILRFAGDALTNPKPLRIQAGQAALDVLDAPAARARHTAEALGEADKIVADTKAAQHAEAVRTNKRLIEEATLAAKKAAPPKAGKSAPKDIAELMRERLSGTAGQDADVAIPARGNQPMADPQGVGQERLVDRPGYLQDQLMAEHGAPAGVPDRIRVPEPPTARGHEADVAKFGFEWPEVGTQYELVADIPGHPKGSHVSAETLRTGGFAVPEKPAGHTEPGIQLLDSESGPNASGESTASREATSRLTGIAARGEEFVVKRGNTIRKLVGPEAVDYQPQPGETFGVRTKDGSFRPLTEGEKKAALTASRGKGAMPIAMRRALFNTLQKRSEP